MARSNSSPSSPNSPSAIDEAIGILCARHMHQVFWLPENDIHGRLRVTYSTTSNFSDINLPAILVCPPMFGGRWMITEFDQLAISKGVRVICFDRPGMGGSTPVPLSIRMKVWLETVPALLKEVDVQHISLLCHSAGTIYGLNTIYYLRHILDPERPYTAMIAPWVHNEHSSATLMSCVSKLPNGILDYWNNVSKFINQKIAPAASWSGGAVTSMSGLFQSNSRDSCSDWVLTPEEHSTSVEVARKIEALQSKYFFEEDTTGANEEARLCLQKGGSNCWLICADYTKYVQDLVKQERERAQSEPTQPKLRLQVYYAESDIMIGKGGQSYFEECWKQQVVSTNVQFESQEMPGTNHETVLLDHEMGALKSIFDEVKRASQQVV